MRHALTSELRVVASPALLERGCVNIIKLDEIKSEAGARWEKLRGSVSMHLEALLRQKLSSSDFFVQIDDTSFLVSMPSVTAEASQIFCLRIAHELHTSMLGSCLLGQVRLSRAVEIQDDEMQAAPIEGNDLVHLAAMAGLDGIPESALLAARRVAPRPATANAVEYSHRYTPLWDAQREAVTTYRCVTDCDFGHAANITPIEASKLELGATLSRIHHAARCLTEHMKVGERFLISIPISYDTLSSPTGRMEVASTCRGLSAALRPYLIFEIGDLPFGVPQSRLSELICTVKPFCRAVAGLLPARTSNYAAYQNVGLQAVGISLLANGISAAEMGSEVIRLCVAAKRLHLLSFVLDAPTRDAIRTARDSGANLISSTIIGQKMPSPTSVRRLLVREVLPPVQALCANTQSAWTAVG